MPVTLSALTIRYRVAQDSIAWLEEQGVDSSAYLAELEHDLRAAYPAATVDVDVSLGGSLSVARYAEDGALDWDRSDDLIPDQVRGIDDAVTSRLLDI